MPEPNYTYEQYLQLMAGAGSTEEMKTIEELLLEDQQNHNFDVMQYIELRGHYVLRFTQLQLNEHKDRL